MPVSSKLKLLKVLDILLDTDENHPITAADIVDKLNNDGIVAERKSIARDIKYLIEYGYEIAVHHDNKLGYYLSKTKFDDWEIKVLVDAIASCKFLNTTDASNLCNKILNLQNKWSREVISNIVSISPPARTKETKIKYAIDCIISAIKNDFQVDFKYYDLDVNGKYRSRRGGKYYQVSPYMLVWNNENYYLVANTFDYDNLSVYRLDRMKFPVVTDCKRRDLKSIEGYTGSDWLKDYISKTFSMYIGNETEIQVICNHNVIGRIFDRFGTNISIKKWDDENVLIKLNVVESEALYAYFMIFSKNMKVIFPKNISEKISSVLQEGLDNYNYQEQNFTSPPPTHHVEK